MAHQSRSSRSPHRGSAAARGHPAYPWTITGEGKVVETSSSSEAAVSGALRVPIKLGRDPSRQRIYSRVGSPLRKQDPSGRSKSSAPVASAVQARSVPSFAFPQSQNPVAGVAQFPQAMGQGRGPPYFVPQEALRAVKDEPSAQPSSFAQGQPLVENMPLSPFMTQQDLQHVVGHTEHHVIHTPEGSAALSSTHPTLHIPKTNPNILVSPPGLSLNQANMDMDVDASVSVHNEVHNYNTHNELNQNLLNIQLNADNSGIVNEAWERINQANLEAANAKAQTAATVQYAESHFYAAGSSSPSDGSFTTRSSRSGTGRARDYQCTGQSRFSCFGRKG